MKLATLAAPQLRRLLRGEGLTLKAPPFVARITSDLPLVASGLLRMYGDFELGSSEDFADFHLRVAAEPGLRRWFNPQARFSTDGRDSFSTLPANQAFHMIEWGLNWAITAHAHQYLVFHAAVIEKHGVAAILPAPPGSGKSTLCAGLVQRGWRLLSDELALYDLDTGLMHGMARPVNLKNASIDAIRAFAPQALMTAPVPDTAKGTLSLMRAPAESIARVHEPARPAWVILPRYEAGASTALDVQNKAQTLMLLADQAFNYDIHGAAGFQATADLVEACDCYTFVYSELDEAVRTFDALASECAPP